MDEMEWCVICGGEHEWRECRYLIEEREDGSIIISRELIDDYLSGKLD